MCGIAVIISGIRFDLSNIVPDYVPPSPQPPEQVLFSADDIKAALSRRGPDSIGSKNVFLKLEKLPFEGVMPEMSTVGDDDSPFVIQEPCGVENGCEPDNFGQLHFIGATLQLRGISPIVQPLVDSSGNVLVYNGEIFGGICVGNDCNDSEILMKMLGRCCSCLSHDHSIKHGSCEEGEISVPQLLSRIKGPWAFIYWQNSSKTLWFGRDAFGRRSLLVHWPTQQDSRFLLTSVSPLSSECEISESKELENLNYWEELPCGMYSLSVCVSRTNGYHACELKRHKWTDANLEELVQWERMSVHPEAGKTCISRDYVHLEPSHRVLTVLREAVMRRTVLNTTCQTVSAHHGQGSAPVAVLFSGGLDSMILSALLHQCLDLKYDIELLNVSFDGQFAPDRITAREGVKELENIAPSRRWKLVEINADLQRLTSEMKHVMSLISPAKTYMDLNIGLALWLAAGGDGWIYGGSADSQYSKHKSEARVLLTGTGADEQCAGYGRYKTKFREGSWLALHEEMKLDMQRIWKRNLGRDDRCIADNGKEARFPFLDEDVIRTLLDMPLWELADLSQPSGIGDKKILREVARLLGISGAAGLPKRAIQFGSRIARESNRINFGSNRAANQASAGSVEIYKARS
ncbi:OLC1v1032607C1 [Oldenlandia corymbosa var. corymbosa]|uniref:OLC1v1032607C1 n=1 Tax=Oldenlandia corymbosa var. corymbosa TaxID=529605 RepID=A0AAV1CMU6_OLDCO|nr:OLC1v1032607C1 [Oldenlandia corymbosa var. corymbosa]